MFSPTSFSKTSFNHTSWHARWIAGVIIFVTAGAVQVTPQQVQRGISYFIQTATATITTAAGSVSWILDTIKKPFSTIFVKTSAEDTFVSDKPDHIQVKRGRR